MIEITTPPPEYEKEVSELTKKVVSGVEELREKQPNATIQGRRYAEILPEEYLEQYSWVAEQIVLLNMGLEPTATCVMGCGATKPNGKWGRLDDHPELNPYAKQLQTVYQQASTQVCPDCMTSFAQKGVNSRVLAYLTREAPERVREYIEDPENFEI